MGGYGRICQYSDFKSDSKKKKPGGAQQGLRDLMMLDENKTFPGEIQARLTAD